MANTALCGVEADPNKFEAMKRHLALNRLVPSPSLAVHLLNCAAWHENTILRFPKIGVSDMGAAASDSSASVDYRGHEFEMLEIQALSLEKICKVFEGPIDIGHWDVQGAELTIAEASRELLCQRFRSLQIGTHSRLIEGNLLQLFHDMGWDVVHQQPCHMSYNKDIPSLEGMTTTDGEIQARNPRLW